jgi:hypothetical protein
VYLGDEVLDHLFGDIDVGDDAVAQRADRFDAVGGLAHHQLCVVADRLDPLDSVQRFDRDDRRLIEHDALAANVNNRVRGAEVDCHVLGIELQKTGKEGHRYCFLSSAPPAGSVWACRHRM